MRIVERNGVKGMDEERHLRKETCFMKLTTASSLKFKSKVFPSPFGVGQIPSSFFKLLSRAAVQTHQI